MRHAKIDMIRLFDPEIDEYSTRFVRFWTAVVERAIMDVNGFTSDLSDKEHRKKVIKARIEREAWNWIWDDAKYFGSFVWICDLLGYDPMSIRMNCKSAEVRTRLKSKSYSDAMKQNAELINARHSDKFSNGSFVNW